MCFFFFQAEDGIRDLIVTGVQTCALPIYHIRLETVDRFVPHSDFYTIDVADWIGKSAAATDIRAFCGRHPELIGELAIAGIEEPFHTNQQLIEKIAAKYLLAIQEAGKIYRHINQEKGRGRFITEISIDETDT